MKKFAKIAGVASAALFAGTVGANAALIDFTNNSTGLSGSIGSTTWTLTGFPTAPITPGGCSNPIGVIACENDGVGIANDEITAPGEYVTLTFSKSVKMVASYFLDLFIAKDLTTFEQANIVVDGAAYGAADATADADDVYPTFKGYKELTGLSLVGTSFTFFPSLGNDEIGQADFALAAVEVAPVPLPAGVLLMGTALGGLGLMRRKQRG